MKKSRILCVLCAATFGFAAMSSHAALVNLVTTPMTASPNSLSFNASGIGVTVEGYHVEYNSADSSTIIYGPFSTATARTSASFTYPHFGRITSTGNGTPLTGLAMLTHQNLGQTDFDLPAGGIQPGFDNSPGSAGSLPSIQFALFSFDTPVDVSQIVIDDVSNFSRNIWVAGGNTAPDFSQGLLTALNGYSFINSPDDASDGLFTHNITPLEGIRYLVIGTPPRSDLIGDLGPITGTAGDQFYINALDITAVPVPAAAWLFGSGLLGLVGMARRKEVA